MALFSEEEMQCGGERPVNIKGCFVKRTHTHSKCKLSVD